MKHISEVLSKRPPVKGKPRRKNGKAGVSKRKVHIPAVEIYAKANSFVFKPEKKTKSQLKKGGRPSMMTSEIVGKLEYAFCYDATVEEACLHAGISRDVYYEFIKKYPEFANRIATLREAPVFVLRQKVIQESQHNADTALKYLERKKKIEFSTRTEVGFTGEVINRHAVDPEVQDLIKQAMGNFADKLDEDDKV